VKSYTISLSGTLAAALLAAGGCQTTGGRMASPPPEDSPTGVETPERSTIVARTPGAPDDSVSFGGVSEGRRPTGIVGIYGETISRSVSASGFGDGEANVAQVTFAREGADFDPDVDCDAEWIAFASTQHRTTSDLYLKSVNGSTLTQLTSDPADDMMPEISPDGEWIAFCSNRAGNWDLYVMPKSGGQPRLITSEPTHELHPSWSPDGRHLVYCKFGEQSQRWELWVTEAANTSVRSFIDYGFLPEWSPDPAQNKILFQRARERGSRYHSIWTIDYVDGQGRNPTEIVSAMNAAVINPAWSPDGSRIVFATVVEPENHPQEKPAEADLWIVRLDGTERMNLTNGQSANFQPTWGADGRVYFVSDRGGQDNIWSVVAVPSGGERQSPASAGAVANVPTEE